VGVGVGHDAVECKKRGRKLRTEWKAKG